MGSFLLSIYERKQNYGKEKKNKNVLFYGKFITISELCPVNIASEYTKTSITTNAIIKNIFLEFVLFILSPLF